MGIREIINRLRRKKAEDEVEIPADWATQEPVVVEPVVEEAVCAPYQQGNKVRFSLGRNKVRISKLMFVIYVVLSLGMVRANPSILLLFVPTILIIMDYIRCIEKLDTFDSWSRPEEIKFDLDNLTSLE